MTGRSAVGISRLRLAGAAVVSAALLLAGCGGTATAPATLTIGDATLELPAHDCSTSPYGTGWVAWSDDPAAQVNGSAEAGVVFVRAVLPDGEFVALSITDPSVTVGEGIRIEGSEDGIEVTVDIPCADFDPGGGTVDLDGIAGEVGQVSCFLDDIAPGVTARGSVGGREFALGMRRAPATAGGFEDVVELTWFDTFEELAARGTFSGEPPYLGRTGLLSFGTGEASVAGATLRAEDGTTASIAADLRCGLVSGN